MAEEKKYYWLKLKRDFFKRHDIRIIEQMPNGKDYVLFYLKLLLESIDHEGNLRFSETIPYNESMLATITDTNIDVVRSAMKILTELQMIEVLDDQTIFMREVDKMIGSETGAAERMRRSRERKSLKLPESVTMLQPVTPSYDDVQKSDIEIDIDIEKEIDIYNTTTTINNSSLTDLFNNAHIPMTAAMWIELQEVMGQGLSLAMVDYAVDQAVRHNALNWCYVSTVLDRIIINGYTTIEQVKEAEAKRKAEKIERAAQQSDRPTSANPLDDIPFSH